MTQVFIVSANFMNAIRLTSSIGHVGYIDTYIWNRVFLSFTINIGSGSRARIFSSLFALLVKILLFFLFFPNMLIGGFAIFRVLEIW